MHTHREDVIYGRKYGTALTMDVYTPEQNANGIGVIFVVSGGWFSAHEYVAWQFPRTMQPLVERGFTVFAVVPGSQPKYTIPEIVLDVKRAVRYIRLHAPEYAIDPKRLGIYGASAGGHLSLMVGLSDGQGDPTSEDVVERISSRVQAICEFYAPTDFFNYGTPGETATGCGVLKDYQAPFDFHDFDPENNTFVQVTDEHRKNEIARQISPLTHVSSSSPPTLMIHGDIDLLVPLQQSEILVEKFQQAGVKHRLIVVLGEAHGWDDISGEMKQIGDWFEEHLVRPADAPED